MAAMIAASENALATQMARASRRAMSQASTKAGRAGPKRRPRGVPQRLGRGVMQGKVYSLHVPECTECIGTVSTSVSFTNTDYVINPSNNVTFPRLSQLASLFELYDFEKLEFKFVSSSATAVASTNTALGTILMNTNYDVTDSAFASQSQMENYGGITEARPSVTTVHKVQVKGIKGGLRAPDSDRMLRYNLVESGNSPTYPSNTSAHDYDLGRFQIASSGAQAASVAGRLYVTYALNLHRWKVDTPTGQSNLAAHYAGAPTSTSAFVGMTQRAGSTLTITFTTAAGGSLSIPTVGRYLITLVQRSGAGSVTTGGGLTASTGATAVAILVSSTVSQVNAGSGGVVCTDVGVFDITAANGLITMAAPTVAGTATSDLFVTQIPGGLLFQEEPDEKQKIASLEQQLSELRQSVLSVSGDGKGAEHKAPAPTIDDVFHSLSVRLDHAKRRRRHIMRAGLPCAGVDDEIRSLSKRLQNIVLNNGDKFDQYDLVSDSESEDEPIHIEPSLVRSPTCDPIPRVNLTMSAADLLERISRK